MQLEKTEGITLRSMEYKERERILTLFTEEKGVISLILKGISRSRPHLLALSTPFCIADFHTLKGSSDLYRLHDATLKESLPELRRSFAHLSAAGEMVKNLLLSQMPEKRAPLLYRLLKSYLFRLPSFTDPTPVEVSFTLKLLLHEGLLSLSCAPPLFTSEEWSRLAPLACAARFSSLPAAPINPLLQDKIRTHFRETLQR